MNPHQFYSAILAAVPMNDALHDRKTTPVLHTHPQDEDAERHRIIYHNIPCRNQPHYLYIVHISPLRIAPYFNKYRYPGSL